MQNKYIYEINSHVNHETITHIASFIGVLIFSWICYKKISAFLITQGKSMNDEENLLKQKISKLKDDLAHKKSQLEELGKKSLMVLQHSREEASKQIHIERTKLETYLEERKKEIDKIAKNINIVQEAQVIKDNIDKNIDNYCTNSSPNNKLH